MVRFLGWLRDVLVSVATGLAKSAVFLVLVFLVLLLISLFRGDGLPSNMVLALDLREPIADSNAGGSNLFTPRRATVMDIVLGLDQAGRDARVKGMVMRLGNGALSTAEAEEIAAAIHRFRARGKFVVAQATAFFGTGMGDYLAASAANEIWMQPKSPFSVSGTGGTEIFLRGLFDKIDAQPQMVKRAEYKSAADMYTEKSMTTADREQLTRLLNSVYDNAAGEMAAARRLTKPEMVSALEKSPQFSEEAKAARLIDRIGYDDEARYAAETRAGAGAKAVKLIDYVRDAARSFSTANIAIVEAAGEIRDGTAQTSLVANAGIAGDDLSAAIRAAARDRNIKAIVLRVDSPGGSVTASDQILHAVKQAQTLGKPVVVSMGSVAASGGYYISTTANRIVAQPGTITGSIGMLTGKVSFGKSVNLTGANTESIAVGKNTLMDSPFEPFTPDQITALNHQADVIYDDFTRKVAAGRKMPLDKVLAVAKGRVWSGADAHANGLVDALGGFWTAADTAAKLGGVAPGQLVFKVYPKGSGFFASLSRMLNGMDASLGLMGRLEAILAQPSVSALLGQVSSLPGQAPGSSLQLKAGNLPQP